MGGLCDFIPGGDKHPGGAGCDKCGLWRSCNTPKIPGVGPRNAKIMLLGEAPGANEDSEGKPFVGASGRKLTGFLERSGIDRSEVYITNTCKCRPPKNATPKPVHIHACADFLEAEIKAVKPKVIVLLGGTACTRILGKGKITQMRGMVIWSQKYHCTVIPTRHPAATLYDKTVELQILEDLRTAKQQSEKDESHKEDVNYQVCTTVADVQRMVRQIKRAKLVAVDVETTGLNWYARKDEPSSCKLLTVAFAYGEQGFARCVPIQHPGHTWSMSDALKVRDLLASVLADKEIGKIGHYFKFDLNVLREKGFVVNNVAGDTMADHHLLDEEANHDLESLTARYTDMGVYKATIARDDLQNQPLQEVAIYNCKDVDATLRLHHIFTKMLTKEDSLRTREIIINPMVDVLSRLEVNGAPVAVATVHRLCAEYKRKVERLEVQWRKLLAEEIREVEEFLTNSKGKQKKFSPNDPASMQVLLFGVLHQEPWKMVKGAAKKTPQQLRENPWCKYASGGKTFKAILEHGKLPKHVREGLTCLSDCKKTGKILSTYFEATIEQLGLDDRIRTTYTYGVTHTGRLSSYKPNLQNVPPGARCMIEAPDGWVILQGDYSQAEYRFLAVVSHDQLLTDAFIKGEDLHARIASEAARFGGSFAINTDDPNDAKNRRKKAKGVNFGIIYGLGLASLAEVLGISKKETKKFFHFYTHEIIPTAWAYLQSVKAEVQRTGQIASVFGRIRRAKDATLVGDSEMARTKRARAIRQLVNAPIQSAASDLNVLAMSMIQEWLDETGLQNKAKLILTVHDSIVMIVRKSVLDKVAQKMKRIMENAPKRWTDVPFVADLEVGKNWGELKPYIPGMAFDEAA